MKFKKSRPGRKPVYGEVLKTTVCLEVLKGDLSISEAKSKYGIKGDGNIYSWLKEFTGQVKSNNLDPMNTTNSSAGEKQQGSDDERAQELIKRNEELQAALQLAQLKITALEVMIEVAESELNIDIRKKSGTKQ